MTTDTAELERLDGILRDPLNGLTWENRIKAADAVTEVIALRAEIARLSTERDKALARVAAAAMEMRERAANIVERNVGSLAGELRHLPIDPDAQKALDKMLAKAQEEAIKEAARIAKSMNNGETAKAIYRKILALLTDGDWP